MYTGTQTNAHDMCEVAVQCNLPLDLSDYGVHVGDNEDVTETNTVSDDEDVAETVDDGQYESDSDFSEESYIYEESEEQFDKE